MVSSRYNMSSRPIIYLAGPYSHPDPAVRLARYEAITKVAAKLVSEGLVVFSPLTMTHPIDLLLAKTGETLGSKYWIEFDESFMEVCSEIRVVKLEGWRESSGIRREIEFFKSNGLPVIYLEKSYVIDLYKPIAA
jgi:hypothetical protein